MTLIEQLTRLAEIAPETCKVKHFSDGDSFIIGEYAFWQNYSNFFAKTLGERARDRPALDWLEGALRQVIEAKGWLLQVEYDPDMGGWRVRLPKFRKSYSLAKTLAEALLAALIVALGGEG